MIFGLWALPCFSNLAFLAWVGYLTQLSGLLALLASFASNGEERARDISLVTFLYFLGLLA